ATITTSGEAPIPPPTIPSIILENLLFLLDHHTLQFYEIPRHQLALPLKRQPRVQAKLPKGLNLDNSLPNTALPAAQGDAQSWISDLAKQADARSSFNELLDTPIDFSNFIMHRLNVDTLTPDLLAGPTYELMTPDLLVPRLVL
nr:hypothetical protein [Tanacetum cinerariifolium]